MRAMFGEIAPRYDFITRIFSFGMDARWKRLGVARAGLADDAVVLDLASGTGDFSELILRQLPRARAVAMDLTEAMLRRARARGLTETACGDATALPFADGTFDCVFVGYGLRNFPCLQSALREIERVTRSGRDDGGAGFLFAPELDAAADVFGIFVCAGRVLGAVVARAGADVHVHSGFAAEFCDAGGIFGDGGTNGI